MIFFAKVHRFAGHYIQDSSYQVNRTGGVMRNWVVLCALMLVFGAAAELAAQGGRGPGGNRRGPDTQRRQDTPPRDNRQGQGQGQGQGEIDRRIGWGEDGTEERVLPGQTVPDKDKLAWLEKQADELAVDKKQRTAFLRAATKAWNETEREDKRWAGVIKSVKDNAEKRATEQTKHKENLAKVWTDSDADLTKKEILNEEQLAAWQKASAHLRAETATDKSVRQDEIRARKLEEWRERAGAAAGGAAGTPEPKEKKEKKDEEDK